MGGGAGTATHKAMGRQRAALAPASTGSAPTGHPGTAYQVRVSGERVVQADDHGDANNAQARRVGPLTPARAEGRGARHARHSAAACAHSAEGPGACGSPVAAHAAMPGPQSNSLDPSEGLALGQDAVVFRFGRYPQGRRAHSAPEGQQWSGHARGSAVAPVPPSPTER